MEETTIVPQPASHAQALIPHFKQCGFGSARLATPFRFDTTDIEVVAFAGKPWDNWSACLAAVDVDGDSRASAAKVALLGVTSVFVCGTHGIDWWGLGAKGPTKSKPLKWNQLEGFFREHKAELAPRAIYDAKLRRPTAEPVQMTFFDVGLMPAVEEDRGKTLLKVVRSEIDAFEDELGDRVQTEQDWEHAYRAVFWLLTAKVLNNKQVPNFINVDLSNVEEVFARIGRHHGVTEELPPFGRKGLEAMEHVAERLLQRGSLADVSSESIAYLYEHALIDKAVHEQRTVPNAELLSVRKRRGIHGTPSVLRDHMLSQLWPLIKDIKSADRRVLEPACGHAPFLTGMVRWLRDWDESGEPVKGHDFLRDRLVGLDSYAFARELAKLNLTLADAEHKNSWTIKDGDMFAPGVLRRYAEKAHILLSNPPYESFVKVGAEQYLDTKEPVKAETQGVEMLNRTLKYLPEGGVFGVVMPVGVLHDKESKSVRRELLKDFDLSEISVFADKLFKHGDHEVAVLMGRKKKPRTKPPVLMYRRVREAGMAAFKERLAFSWEREVSPGRFAQSDDADLRVPELDDLWTYLSENPKLGDYAAVGQGLSYKGEHLPRNAWTVEPFSKGRGVPGFENVPPDLAVFSSPATMSLNISPEVILRPRAGVKTGVRQVLLNYHPVSRKPWRLKPFIDLFGHAVTSSFLTVRPRGDAVTLNVIWAVLNSPVANAFVYSHLQKRNILSGTLERLPTPKFDPTMVTLIDAAATRYLEVARTARRSSANNRETVLTKHPRPPRSAPSRGQGGPLFEKPVDTSTPAVTDSAVKEALLSLDAAVLRAYDLPPRLERQLLDLFTDVERKGVGLDGLDGKSTFRGYYPAGFTSALPLYMVISERFERARADKTAERFIPGGSPYIRDVLHAVASGKGEV
jgi:hypothetical protein